MKDPIFLKFILSIVLAVLVHDVAEAQNQVLAKKNGGVSWHGVDGGANVKARRTTDMISPADPNSLVTVTYSTEDYDLSGSFNPSTGVFSPSEVGYYIIMASVNWTGSSNSNVRRSIELVKNGLVTIEQNYEEVTMNANSHSSIYALVYNYGTDNFRIQVSHNSNTSQTISGTTGSGQTTFAAFGMMDYNRDLLKRKNGGATWESGANMNTKVRAWRTAQTLPSGLSTVDYSTENYDLNNDFNLVSSIFTPPEAGYYAIIADININYPTSNRTGTASIQLVKNNSTVVDQNSDYGFQHLHSILHTVVYSDGTDNYRIKAWHNVTPSLQVDVSELTIFRVGGPNDEVLTKINGGGSWGDETTSCVKAKRTSDMTIPTSNAITITYSSEDFDTNNEFNPVTGMFTPTQSGCYVFMGTANWDNFNSTVGDRGIRLMRKTISGLGVLQKVNYQTGSNVMTSNLATVIYHDGTPNTSYYMQAFQDSGSSHDIGGSSSAPGCTFTVFKL